MTRDDVRADERRPDDRRFLGALAGVAGLLAFALFVLPRVVPALDEARQRLERFFERAGDSSDVALARYRGRPYVDALKKIRETIPAGEAYYLVPVEPANTEYLVRFDLAPRRPVLLPERSNGAPPAGAPRWVVLARVSAAGPEVLPTADYFRRPGSP
jgi:hypothetical protein